MRKGFSSARISSLDSTGEGVCVLAAVVVPLVPAVCVDERSVDDTDGTEVRMLEPEEIIVSAVVFAPEDDSLITAVPVVRSVLAVLPA